MLSRREMLFAPAALLALSRSAGAAAGKMSLALHQNTSSRAGYRGSLEGWAKAGIKEVEITSNLLDDFLKGDTLPAAKRVLSDLGLTPVSASCGVGGLLEPNPNRAMSLDNLKKRCDMFGSLGLTKIYSTTGTTIKPTADDYKAAAGNLREVGETAKPFGMTVNFEFVRTSTFASTLTTLLSMMRGANHPNVGVLFDCYHFWSGLNKLEDLDALRPGEIKHVHFNDVPDMPRELLDTTTRVMPGDGVSPFVAILGKLKDKGYDGPLSVELLGPTFQNADPYALAAELKPKAEGVMRKAGVL